MTDSDTDAGVSLPDTVAMVIPAREKDLGGFMVRRVLPYARRRMVGPWIFFDHMGPADFAPGLGVNVRPHPHINLATVTYLFKGNILHRDSLGTRGVISPGDINLMVAGKGIVHSEREEDEAKTRTRHLDGLQLWLALPEADEEIDPAFYHYDAAEIPSFDDGQAHVRVMMGEAFGLRSPVKTYAQTLYVEAKLKLRAELQAPMGVEERAIYVCDGELGVDGLILKTYEMAVLTPGALVRLTAISGPVHFVIVGGEKLSERHIYWNFVSSRPERIEQAKADWKAQTFPKVPGDDQEFIPLPE
ncbi:pirin C-terminal cupin domain protein [Asticcacaulis biprosthecium C19]|uniref:Pirin C-terminal cupin domain protein n=1 Tax=Asticcacaulis biprosthecium C19 TaxID=715226 RepID=F4QSY2_9CAUL|nr:pirin family protein [Asticcacaulis biprosthecium]EGF89852.1 pirin C-terminal cupin domain protein [Asticcacaulis biprosthecium C19]